MNNPEKALIRAAQRFDQDALAEIYDTFSPGIFRYAVRLMGDTDQAEDCVAETFSRFLHALRNGRGPEDYLQAYLYRIAHNWITDYYRHKPRENLPLAEDFPADQDDPVLTADIILDQERTRRALLCLTPEQRQVILLKFFEGWENQEIARALGRNIGAIKALQHRALASLRGYLFGVEEILRS